MGASPAACSLTSTLLPAVTGFFFSLSGSTLASCLSWAAAWVSWSWPLVSGPGASVSGISLSAMLACQSYHSLEHMDNIT